MMNKPSLAIAATDESLEIKAKALSQSLGFPLVNITDTEHKLLLVINEEHIELRLTAPKSPKPIYVDFLSGAVAHRHQYGGGRGQLIARAVGLQNKKDVKRRYPKVLDLTAGLGRDAFVLATLGCDVTMVERSAIIATLLQDGLLRAQNAQDWFSQLKLRLVVDDAHDYLQTLSDDNKPDVIYLDPMFPDSKKSALVKKEMRYLKEVVGDDLDAGALLPLAFAKAKYRVVVKRAKLAPTLTETEPSLTIKGKSSRYDVYIKAPIATS